MSLPGRRIVILGAGPIGVEAGLHGAARGHDVRLFERGSVGAHVRDWGHVRLFSPWALNRSALGLGELRRIRARIEDEDAFPTGHEYVERYLRPLAGTRLLAGRIHEGWSVVRVGRERIGKLDLVGGPRERYPFRILLDTPDGERITTADAVLDCTGTYGNPNWLGNGNVPAVGERCLRSKIVYTLEDIAGAARARYAGRRVLLVGDGYSAATALEALVRLEGTSVVWAVRTDRAEPLPRIPDDPLPGRDRLAALANDLARGADDRVDYRRATVVERIAERGAGFEIVLSGRGTEETVQVDRILAHVGYSPDSSIHRELQVHECYASGGPMKLAASLLGDASADCLAQAPADADTLRNPEPGFLILGAKSYGRHSTFLIRTGLRQIADAYSLIEATPRPQEPTARLSAG